MKLLLPALLAAGLLAGAAEAASLKEEGDKAFDAGDFTVAAACYAGAGKEEPALARNEAFLKRLTHAKAGASCEAAERLLAGGHGLGALDEVRTAMKLMPEWDRPQKLLAKAQAAAAGESASRAERKLAEADLAGAERETAAALALDPDHAAALRLRETLVRRRDEAQTAAQATIAAMTAGEWEKAETACRRSLALDAGSKESRLRLGEIFWQRAQVQEAEGHPGAALLGCRRGAAWTSKAARKAQLLLDRLRREEMPRFRWQVEGPEDLRVAKWLAARVPPLGDKAAKDGPVREVKVAVNAAEATLARVKTETVTTPWYEERQEFNPEFDTVRLKLAKAEAMLRDVYRRMDAAPSRAARRALAVQAQTWANTVRDLVEECNATPDRVVVRVEHADAHTREQWRATGRLSLTLAAEGAEPLAATESFDKSAVVEPAVPGKGPALPDQGAILDVMGKQALDKVLPALAGPALVARIAKLRHDAAKLAAAGEAQAALELHVRAAALAGVLDPKLGEESFKELEAKDPVR